MGQSRMWHVQAPFWPALLGQSHRACMAAAVSFPWLKLRICSGRCRHAGNTCWVHCLCFSLCFHPSAPPSPPLYRICHCHFFHLHLFSPSLSPATPLSHPFGFILPSLHPCIPALSNHRCDRKALQTPPQVLVYLTRRKVSSLYYTVCGKNDTTGLTSIAGRHCVYTICFYWK